MIEKETSGDLEKLLIQILKVWILSKYDMHGKDNEPLWHVNVSMFSEYIAKF